MERPRVALALAVAQGLSMFTFQNCATSNYAMMENYEAVSQRISGMGVCVSEMC